MPVNRNALIRYKTIDKCLQNRYRQWTLEDLIEACSEALYEYEGIEKGVSRRTVQGDIQMMRSDKLGYNAPIVVREKKYYTYEDSDYSITNIPLTDQDLSKLTEAVEFLKQFQGFSHFRELDGMVQKLEDHVYSQKTQQGPVIDFEKNENLRGLEYLDALYQAILQKRCLHITYQSFKARQAQSFDFSPYLLKEFKNRWFLIGKRYDNNDLINLALDRIQDLSNSTGSFEESNSFSANEHFKHSIGVTVNSGLPIEEVLLRVGHKQAPYVLTKPLHWSQEERSRDYYGVIIALKVRLNFELEKEILGFGEGMTVIAPERLRKTIQRRLSYGAENYDNHLDDKALKKVRLNLEHGGNSVLKKIYTLRELQKIRNTIGKYLETEASTTFSIRRLFHKIPILRQLLWTPNLDQIIQSIAPGAFCVKALYFDKNAAQNWLVNWHQDLPINVEKRKAIKGYTAWSQKEEVLSVCPPDEIAFGRFSLRIHLDPTDEQNGALKVILGSHKSRHNSESIAMITQNSIPFLCNVPAGGVHILHPMILHASEKVKADSKNRRRVIHLEFSNQELAEGLTWAERVER